MLGFDAISEDPISTIPTAAVPARAKPGRILSLVADMREILVAPDDRLLQLQPDVRAILLPPDEDDMPPTPPQYWSPAASADVDIYWLSLTQWLPPDDTVSNPSVVILPAFTGDNNPVTVVGTPTVETGDLRVVVPPGVPIIDPGPRIQMKLTGGTPGRTYTTVITWQDDQGRTINRQALLPIQW